MQQLKAKTPSTGIYCCKYEIENTIDIELIIQLILCEFISWYIHIM